MGARVGGGSGLDGLGLPVWPARLDRVGAVLAGVFIFARKGCSFFLFIDDKSSTDLVFLVTKFLMNSLHETALVLSKKYLSSEKELFSVLVEMQEKKVFRELGYTGIFAYCVGALGFSESQASYFASVAKVSILKDSVKAGEVSLSRARRLVSVITGETKDVWIERANTLPQRELEKQVALVNPRAVQEKIRAVDLDRHEMKLGVSDRTREKFQRAVSLLSRKNKKMISMEEALEELLDSFLEKNDPIKKAERTFLRKVNPTKGRTIPAVVKAQVNLRDRGKCQAKGCSNQTWTEFHHVKAYAEGGAHRPDNLITLCSAHHHSQHPLRAET